MSEEQIVGGVMSSYDASHTTDESMQQVRVFVVICASIQKMLFLLAVIRIWSTWQDRRS